MRITLVVVVAFSLVASTVFAQQTTHADVVVTDGKGKVVHGLTAADFEVVRGNQAGAVASVAEVGDPAPRRIVVLFDNSSLTLAHRRQVVAALKTWIDANLRPVDHIAVGASSPVLRQVLDWSADKAAITAALDTATRDASNHGEQERRRAERLINDVMVRAAEADPRDPMKPSFDEMMRTARSYAAMELQTVDATAAAIGAAMTWFPRDTEKRVLLIAGEGLPRNPGYDMFMHLNALKIQIETSGPALLVETSRRAAPLTEARGYDVEPILGQLRDGALSRGIAVYAMNPGRGEDSGGNVENLRVTDSSADFARMTNAMSGYDLIASRSGGMAFSGMPSEKALAQITSDLTSYYALTYDSPAIGDSTIRAKGGQRVRSVLAAAPVPADDRMRDAVLALHKNPPSSNDLAITLAMEPARDGGTERIVPLRVFIPITNLRIEPSGGEVTGGFAVYISTANGQGGATTVMKKTHEIHWPPEALAHGQGKNMTFAIDVSLPPGFNAISVGVLDTRSEKTGFERVSVAP